MSERPESDAQREAALRPLVELWTQSVEQSLRSPAFLQAMSRHLELLARGKRQLDQLSGPSRQAAEAERPAALRPAQEPAEQLLRQMAAKLERIEQRLAAIESRLPLLDERHATSWRNWERFWKPPPAGDIVAPLPLANSQRDPLPGATAADVVFQEHTLRVLRYQRAEPARWCEPVLICFALVNRPYIMDLQADRSVVRRLLDRGFDVYLIDWGVPAAADHALGLADYVCGFLPRVVDFVRQHSDAPRINLLGYCMGGTLATMFTALHPDPVRNLILMAAPIDFAGHDGLLNLWTNEKYFDVDALIDAYGNCPGEFLQACFQLMKPVQNFVEKYQTFYERMHDDRFLENFFAMERWGNDSIPVAGETFRQFVKWLYQQNQLVRGQLELGGRRVELSRIECPLLLLAADFDHLVPTSSTLALARHTGSRDVHQLLVDAGHIGLAVSSKAHRTLWPAAADWIATRSSPKAP
ncbi:MAG: class III poly(R)-hydroxyalkanoic acid synthase subunit PhaC [Pirellulaceae bacterium]|nr:class III poly(R)-hydroxyalkanoic acid synthase subunit PhaC [Pirellulaceae bacterium]